MNGVYAYFTASAQETKATATTAIIAISFDKNNIKHQIIQNSATITGTKLIPGDTASVTTILNNTGTESAFVVLKFMVSVKKTTDTEATVLLTTY